MNRTHGVTHYDPDNCFGCRVKYHVQIAPNGGSGAFRPHFNYSVGEFVRTEAEFRDVLKRKGDDNSEKTGISHAYEYIPPSDLRTMQPPEAPNDPTPSVADGVAKRSGQPVHPTFIPETEEKRARIEREERDRARRDAQTRDLIPEKKTKDLMDAGC